MIDNDTHSVLFELQKNLEDLSSAKEQVDFFRGKALEITDGISEVQRKYVEHLQGIQSDYENRVNDLRNDLTQFLSESQEENTKTVQKVVSESEETIKKGIEKFEVISNKINASNDEKVEAINNLLEHYRSVVEASNFLIETLTEIDFPTKLDALSSKSQLIIESITNAKQALEIKLNESQNSILEKIKVAEEYIIQNNNSKISSLDKTLAETNSNLKTIVLTHLNEQSQQVNERLDNHYREITTLKTFLYIITAIIVVGIVLNFILK